MATYDHEAILIGHTVPLDADGIPETDADGNQIIQETRTTILCSLQSVGRSEFYNAAAAGLRPEILLTVHGYEYAGEKRVEFEGITYGVIRTYATGFEEIELTCERSIGDG